MGPTVRGGLAMSCDRESVTSCQDLLAMRPDGTTVLGTPKIWPCVCQLLAGRGKSNQGKQTAATTFSHAGGCIVTRRVGGTKIVENN